MTRLFFILSLVMLITTGCIPGENSSGSGSSSANFAGAGDSSNESVDLGHHPEPTTVALIGIGLAGLAAARLRKKRRNKR